MAVTAIVLSIVAILISVVSAWYTRMQGVASREQARTDRARRIDEKRPTFDSTVVEFNGGGWYRLDLTLSSHWPLTRIEVAIVEGNGVRFGRGQTGVRPAGVDDPMTSAEWAEELRPGTTACWKVDLEQERSSSILLEVTGHGEDGQQWTTPVRVQVPRFPDEYFRETRRRYGN